MADTRDDENNSKLTIEGEWEASDNNDSPYDDGGEQNSPRRGKAKKLIGLALVLALLAGLAAAGYFGWQYAQQYLAQQTASETRNSQLAAQLKSLEQRVDRVNQTIAADSLNQAEQLKRISDEVSAVANSNQLHTDELVSLQTQLGDWAARFGTGDKTRQSSWQLAEAEWLLWLANMRLQLQHQYAGAITALGHADQLLQQVNHPQMRQVRGLIAEEVITLKTTERPDIDSIALVLLALSNQVAELPLPERPRPAGDVQAPTLDTNPTEPEADKAQWRKVLTGVWQEIRGLVVIRRQEKNLRPWLSENEEQLIYQGLQVRLDASRLAALRGQNTLFQQSIRSAQTWLLTWFDSESSAVQAVDNELNALASQKITLELPDISGSLTALRDLRQQRGQQ